MGPQLGHEKLDVYRLSLEFVGWAAPLLGQLRETCGPETTEVRNQLDRASLSILLNIAEGNGKRLGKSRSAFLDIARGSATECAACLDALTAKRALSAEQVSEGKGLIVRIVQMLSRMLEQSEINAGVRETEAEYRMAGQIDYDYDDDHDDDSDPKLILILGGARSGKSTFAERLAAARGTRVTYLATAQAFDDEMVARIAKHQSDRPAHWRTAECPFDPGAAMRAHAGDTDLFLLDCLTLLVSNLLLNDALNVEETVHRALDGVLAAYREAGADLLLVSNEVGLGLVPDNVLGRQYRDVLGRVNQRLAVVADHVYFLVAGLPLDAKALACSPIPLQESSR